MAPPPGYVAYGSAPTPLAKVSRVKGLATAISVLVGIAGAASLLTGLLQFGAADQAEQYLAGRISDDEFTESIVGFSAVQGASGLATLAAGIVVMIWMYRITANLRAFGQRTTWHPLFAIFGWVLPPGILYIIPFLMLREQWKKSATPTGESDQGENPVLWAWFALFGIVPLILIAVQVSTFTGAFNATSVDAAAESLADAGSVGFLASLVSALAAVAWIVFTRQLTRRHTAMTGES